MKAGKCAGLSPDSVIRHLLSGIGAYEHLFVLKDMFEHIRLAAVKLRLS